MTNKKTIGCALSEQAAALWAKGKSRKAFSLFLQAARRGDATAQHNAGYFYDVGEGGVKKDRKQALYWYRRSWRSPARQTDTCSNIARIYAESGSSGRAIHWWNKAVALGDGDAVLDLAKHLIKMSGRSHKRVFGLLKRASAGHFEITEAGKEEAAAFLAKLQKGKRKLSLR